MILLVVVPVVDGTVEVCVVGVLDGAVSDVDVGTGGG